jgi:hypothetical protein
MSEGRDAAGDLSPEAEAHMERLRSSEAVPIGGVAVDLTTREAAVAALTLLAPLETRKTIKQAGELLGLTYEVTRASRTRAAIKLGLDASELAVPRGAKTDPSQLSELEAAVSARTIQALPEALMSIVDAASELGVDFRSAYNARLRALFKLGLDGKEHSAPRSSGVRLASFMSWEDESFALIAHVNPDFSLGVKAICKLIGIGGKDIPEHLRGAACAFRLRTASARIGLIRRAQATVAVWKKRYSNGKECAYCAGLPTRRPCPGTCPVCDEPGENEILERPELLHSSAGLIDDEQ